MQMKTVDFASRPEEACAVLESILGEVRARGYSEETVFAIRLAMDEALNNAVCHGNEGDAGKRVVVEYGVDGARFCATVTDEGRGFRPESVPDPTCRENLERPCGRGVMLMKAYMSEVRFNDRGNGVTLVKYRDCPLPVRRGGA